MSGEIAARSSGPVLHLVLDRPGKRNALTASMVEELIEHVERAPGTGTDLIVFRGTGRSFSAGFDFTGLDAASDGDLMRRFVRIEYLLNLVYRSPCVTMALAQGPTIGAGADLVCACSQRIAAPDTTFRLPGLYFGVVLGTRRLAARVGTDHAARIQRGGVTLNAAEALRLGFVSETTPTERWQDRVAEVAEKAAAVSAPARLPFARAASGPFDGDADMADLARAASAPGLAERIRAFRQRAKASGDRR